MPVNFEESSTIFSFIPNCYNVAFVVQNSNNIELSNTSTGGTDAEGSFSQFARGGNIGPSVSAPEFD